MEINALFDLWNTFTQVPCTEDDAISEPFYTFPVGTTRLEIIGWFSHQSTIFKIHDTVVEGRRTFTAINYPATR